MYVRTTKGVYKSADCVSVYLCAWKEAGICTLERVRPSLPHQLAGLGEMCLLRAWVHAVPKTEISRQPAFPQNFGFRLGRDKCHGLACFHLSFEDGCEENCERNPCSLARRVRDGLRVRACCMHTVVIAFRV